MKMKIVPIAVIAICFLSLALIAPIHGSYSGVVYARTDKSSYLPGDSGTLYITVRNTGTQSFAVKNITVNWPWKAFITDHWDGNFTTVLSTPAALAGGQNYNTQYSFTIPTDGRAGTLGDTVDISVGTDMVSEPFISPTSAPSIPVALPTYQPLSLTNSVLPIIEIVLLGIAVVMLALVWMGISRLSKK